MLKYQVALQDFVLNLIIESHVLSWVLQIQICGEGLM